jgi:hypothetical protein
MAVTNITEMKKFQVHKDLCIITFRKNLPFWKILLVNE